MKNFPHKRTSIERAADKQAEDFERRQAIACGDNNEIDHSELDQDKRGDRMITVTVPTKK